MLHIWNVASGRLTHVLTSDLKLPVVAIRYLPSGTDLATILLTNAAGDQASVLGLWSVSGIPQLRVRLYPTVQNKGFNAMAVTADGKHILAATEGLESPGSNDNGGIEILSVGTGKQLQLYDRQTVFGIQSIAVAQGSLFAYGRVDGGIVVAANPFP